MEIYNPSWKRASFKCGNCYFVGEVQDALAVCIKTAITWVGRRRLSRRCDV